MYINIDKKENCSGCYSCKNVCPLNCIKMKIDYEGFWYPYVNKLKCIDCGLCVKSCPIINSKQKSNIPRVYGGYSLDEKILTESSSGGLFTELASRIIELDGIVFGATFDSEFGIKHVGINDINDLKKLRGSKYVQSKIGKTFKIVKELLDNGKLVYFSGTPCQVDGLLCFLKKDYENLICQDIVCHGVPSPKIWKLYLKRFKITKDTKISFRKKKISWENYSFCINDNFNQLAKDNDYIKLFLNNYTLRPSCYKCHSKSIHRKSDITLADFWGVKNTYPDLYNSMGTSLILINSDKGQKLFDSIAKHIKYCEVDIKKAISENSSINVSASLPNNRKEFFKEINDGNFKRITNKYITIPRKLRFKRWLRKFLRK